MSHLRFQFFHRYTHSDISLILRLAFPWQELLLYHHHSHLLERHIQQLVNHMGLFQHYSTLCSIWTKTKRITLKNLCTPICLKILTWENAMAIAIITKIEYFIFNFNQKKSICVSRNVNFEQSIQMANKIENSLYLYDFIKIFILYK